ncbi:hypothetical protein HIM_03768 [Hirsutella minnesotensis 3608]|uniref:Uncharacterized protein n=1 Tax=Hirsutella minnesotensis 3608 TaxID=1043627 RepID=A0A0F7ZM19_9HYPO|nr:hypothetical protein HIM_03768 [Hirsutella minnesotensis 3608]
MDIEESGLLDIQLSDSEEQEQVQKIDRTGQTEAEFQLVKQDYRAKVENGQIHSSVQLPLTPGTKKQLFQEAIHAVEELYFFRRYQEALNFIQGIHSDGSAEAFDRDSRELLHVYQQKCQEKLISSCYS